MYGLQNQISSANGYYAKCPLYGYSNTKCGTACKYAQYSIFGIEREGINL